jgi:hypothetical protein
MLDGRSVAWARLTAWAAISLVAEAHTVGWGAHLLAAVPTGLISLAYLELALHHDRYEHGATVHGPRRRDASA